MSVCGYVYLSEGAQGELKRVLGFGFPGADVTSSCESTNNAKNLGSLKGS